MHYSHPHYITHHNTHMKPIDLALHLLFAIIPDVVWAIFQKT